MGPWNSRIRIGGGRPRFCLFLSFLLDGLGKIDWNGGHGDGRVGERCGSDLITAPASTARTDLDGFGNDPADSK